MRAGALSQILVDLVALGHYGADVHVPFHATANYDGQLTGQKGVHARWEERLVERYVHPNSLRPTPVRYLDDPTSAVFSWLVESAADVPAALAADNAAYSADPDYKSVRYQDEFWRLQGPSVKQQLDRAIGDVDSLWYSAWIAAGCPALSGEASEPADTFTAPAP
jgi:hypothetical protein